jgi:hypothetical protein
MKPYTYLIGWSDKNIWYYGAQYGRNSNPKNLWITYFTSSKYVKECRILYGEPDVIEIRKVFSTPIEAKEWETKVLIKIKAVEKEKWLNKTISNGYPVPPRGISTRGIGWKHSEETKRKISESNKKIFSYVGPCTEERKEKLKEWKKEKRYNYDGTKYNFIHKDNKTFFGTMCEFSEKYNLPKSNICSMLKGRLKSVKGWRVNVS